MLLVFCFSELCSQRVLRPSSFIEAPGRMRSG